MHWNRNDHSCLTLCSTWQNWHQWRTQEQLVPLGLPRLLSHSDGWTSCWRCAPRNKEKEESTETLRDTVTGLLPQLAGDRAALSTDRTVPPSGICVCPPCARSRWWPGLPSGSAAGWCGTHLEDLRRSPTCHCQHAAGLEATGNMWSPTRICKKDVCESICGVFTRVSIVLKRPVARLDLVEALQM